ncbi:MAG: hypothetical protein SNJ77_11595 [Cytophagales bacterium]
MRTPIINQQCYRGEADLLLSKIADAELELLNNRFEAKNLEIEDLEIREKNLIKTRQRLSDTREKLFKKQHKIIINVEFEL